MPASMTETRSTQNSSVCSKHDLPIQSHFTSIDPHRSSFDLRYSRYSSSRTLLNRAANTKTASVH